MHIIEPILSTQQFSTIGKAEVGEADRRQDAFRFKTASAVVSGERTWLTFVKRMLQSDRLVISFKEC